MPSAPSALHDPAAAAMHAVAQASMQALHDDLASARRGMAAAVEAAPSTTLDWLGPSSEALRLALDRLETVVGGAHDDLESAVALVRAELS